MTPKYIIWHTAAHGVGDVDYDTTAAEIDRWHRARGWAGIGYHAVVRKGGAIEPGRAVTRVGAHALGLNERSLGICFSGHGDIAPLTAPQMGAGLRLTREWMEQFNIPPRRVIGHREINDLIPHELNAAYRTDKSCPGRLVDIREVRVALMGDAELEEPPTALPRVVFRSTAPTDSREIKDVTALQAMLAQRGLYRMRIDGWAGRGTSEAVHALLGSYLQGDPRA